ncbi:MAG TPA: FHA domain-containing protein [Fimbriimonadaceae bacterium]|nr:FHA domain-containing protein [Fimbriimonadaceae bacterium]
MRRLVCLLLCLISSVGLAAKTVTVTFPKKGTYDVWTSPTWPMSWPSKSTRTTSANTEVSVADGETVFLFDAGSSNIAAKKASELKGEWKPTEADFNLIGIVNLKVEHKGQPVGGALVKATAGRQTYEVVLDPSQLGQIRLIGVAPGNLSVSVTYRSEGKQMPPLEQTFKTSLKRDKAEPTFTVAISDPVAIAKPEPKPGVATPTQNPNSEPVKKGNPLQNILITLLVLAGASALGYFLLKQAAQKSDLLKEKLTQLGVEVPEPPSDDEAIDDTPVPVPTPKVVQKIVLDDVAPSPTGNPAFVAEMGERIDILEGISRVGREPGLELSFPNESSISRSHAEITRNASMVSIRDVGSTNGTFVNGNKIGDSVELKPGDQVQFGAVRFRFEA